MGFYIRAIITAPNYEVDRPAGLAVTAYLASVGADVAGSRSAPGDDGLWFVERKNLDVDALIDTLLAAPWSSADGRPCCQLFIRTDDERLFTEVSLWRL